jgi:homoserine kinase
MTSGRTGTSWAAGPVTVRVPATSANLGPGFDALGLALTLHDHVTARITPGGLDVQVTGIGTHTAAAGDRHLVVRAMRAAFDAIGAQPPGLSLSCRNEVPHGFGLGSSAAAIVAGLLAARALAGPDGKAAFSDDAVLALAAEMEGHPDNVAACLLGGLVISWPSGEGVRAVRLEPLAELAPVVCLPAAPLPTEAARKVLPAQIPHADAVANSARVALLITALTGRPDLLLAGTEDFLHQRYRAAAMPETASLIGRLREAGIAAAVSGAGPSVLAFPASDVDMATATDLADAARWRMLRLAVDTEGAALVP